MILQKRQIQQKRITVKMRTDDDIDITWNVLDVFSPSQLKFKRGLEAGRRSNL